ncbi:hypothetical protein IFM89_029653 [Coptis chinensis]|uniref:Uncharacterized protein n=1 Tax=Coptis chinensis TaxID=261450 RepID=A0A835IG68_9MAGN|nr:hypothetical protein IFM89_029653 [Coptis chinensis]
MASEMDVMSSQVQYSDTLLREGMHIHVDSFPATSYESGGSHIATSQPSSQSARPSKLPQKKRKSMGGGGNDVMEGMRFVMHNVANSLRVRSEIKRERTEIERERIAIEASKNNAPALTWDQICLAIDEIDMLDEEQKIAVMELFSQDGAENLKMFFLKISTNKRASWLLKKLGDN